MKITQINRDVCKQLRVDMNEAIRSKLEEYGLHSRLISRLQVQWINVINNSQIV
jgi:hypothetical protein